MSRLFGPTKLRLAVKSFLLFSLVLWIFLLAELRLKGNEVNLMDELWRKEYFCFRLPSMVAPLSCVFLFKESYVSPSDPS
jgi:hypothetical protein